MSRTTGRPVSAADQQRVWQLRLLAERRGHPAPPRLRALLADPAQLQALLDWADRQGDADLREQAAYFRLLSAPASSPLALGAAPGWLIALVVLGGAVLGLVSWLAGRGQSVRAIEPATIEDASADHGTPAAVRTVFRLHGSNTVGEELAPALVTAWMRRQGAATVDVRQGDAGVERDLIGAFPDRGEQWRVEIHAHGSSTAFVDLGAGTADAGMSSRRIKQGEVERLRAALGDLSAPASETVVGLDGLAVIVHRSNPIDAMTAQQVALIFAGRITDWSEVGGMPGRIERHARDDRSGTYDTFKSLVLDAHDVSLDAGTTRHESSTALADHVAASPDAIGFIGLPYVRGAKALGIAETATTLPILPTPFTVGTEDYPLSRRLYLYAPARQASRELQDFLAFAASDAGQDVVKSAGLVSQNLYADRVRTEDASLPPAYRVLTADAERLSLNFRFLPGSEHLDSKAQRDLGRLVAYLARHPERETLLLGFTDSIGDPSANQALSLQRARGVEAMLQARGVFPRVVTGFGQAIPVASNATSAGRDKNRRVEVWVR